MKILLLEPHGDDALISCTSLLYDDTNDIDLVTFSESRSSEGLRAYFPSIKNCTYLSLDDLYFKDNKPLLNTHKVHRDYLNGIELVGKYDDMLIGSLGFPYLRLMDNFYEALLNIDMNQYELVVSPVGLSHPSHVGLRNAVIKLGIDKPIIWYVDKPYISTRYNKEILTCIPKYLGTDREVNPGYVEVSDRDDIYYILSKVYPSEVRLYRFTGDIIAKYPNKYLYSSRHREVIEPLIPSLESVDCPREIKELL